MGVIQQSSTTSFDETTGLDNSSAIINLNIYPNPFKDVNDSGLWKRDKRSNNNDS